MHKISRHQLLQTPLNRLPLSLDVPWLVWARGIVERQLQIRGLRVQPHYWISDEWFCPDGVAGIAVPFFLLHPRLMQLEREMVGFVDGSTPLKRLKILRHEMGHVVDNAYRLRRRGGASRRQVFGDSRMSYPDSYEPKVYSRSYVRHLGAAYAQSHPDEDFAETFAVWLQPKKQWRIRYQNTPALEKLEWMNQQMNSLKGQAPELSNHRRVDPIDRNTMTVQEYYTEKRRRLGIEQEQTRPARFVVKLHRKVVMNSTDSDRHVELHRFLQKNIQGVLQVSSRELNAPRYKLEPLFRQCIQSAKKQNIKIPVPSESEVRRQLKASFMKEARQYLNSGGGRIWL